MNLQVIASPDGEACGYQDETAQCAWLWLMSLMTVLARRRCRWVAVAAGCGAATSRLAAAPCARGMRGPPVVRPGPGAGRGVSADCVVIVVVEQQGRQVEGAVTGQDGGLMSITPVTAVPSAQQVGGGEVVVDEVLAVRDGRPAAVRDAAQHRQQVTGIRAGRQGGVQAVPVAARGQRPGDQAPPSPRPGTQAGLGVVEPEQVRQQPGHPRILRAVVVKDTAG